MKYAALKFVAFLIKVFAVFLLLGTFIYFAIALDLVLELSNQIDGVATNETQLDQIVQSFGQEIGLSFAPLPIPSIMLTVRVVLIAACFRLLFEGIFASLLAYGFGGLIGAVIDIAEARAEIEYRRLVHSQQEDAPTSKPWASFPSSAYTKPRIPSPPSEDRPRPKGKWDLGE